MSQRVDVKAAAIAGVAGGAVYLATMEIDNRLLRMDVDDLKLLGRPFVKNPDAARIAGIPVHFSNAMLLSLIYGAVARDRLPGPAWLRGVLYANIENTLLYPLTAFEQRHPGIRNGEIDRYFSLRAYMQSVPRHITFGAVMATVYERLRSK